MKVKPLTGPQYGMKAYNGRLMVKILTVKAVDHFNFHVYNGDWRGTYCEGKIEVYNPYESGPNRIFEVTQPFEQVVEMTDDERDRLYINDPLEIEPKKELPEDDGIPY